MTIVNYFENEVKSTQDTLSNKIDPLSPIWTDRKRELIQFVVEFLGVILWEDGTRQTQVGMARLTNI